MPGLGAMSREADNAGQSKPSGLVTAPEVEARCNTSESTLAMPSSDLREGSGTGDVTPRLQPGQNLLGRFTVLRFIAAGGMGTVYEATDLTLKAPVALKVIRHRVAANPISIERFQRELLLARRVAHPNVCRVYELYETMVSGVPLHFLTMELLEGETLARRLARLGRMTIAEAFPLVAQMCDGLSAAHGEGVIHRDFKSGNVMLVPRPGSAGERLVITDFGVARAMDMTAEEAGERGPLTGVAGMLGTPDYMAPEQVTGGQVSPATDVYALGIVMYEMVTGQLPFRASTPLGTAVRHIKEVPPNPRLALPGLDRRWSETIVRCLHPEPSRRFQRATDVPAALSGHRPRSRSRLAAGLLGALLVLLVVSAVAWRWMPDSRSRQATAATPPLSIAVLAFADMSPQHDQEYFSDGVAQEIISALTEVQGLRVVARSSSFSFKGRNEDLRAVGRKLNVAHILEGSVRKSDRQVRVTAQLVNADDGYELWSKTFDRDLVDIFAVQTEIARAVAAALRERAPRLLGTASEGEDRPRTPQPIAPEAYAAYLSGQELIATGSSSDFSKAISAFQRAIKLAPDYARAHAALAQSLVWSGGMAGESDPVDSKWRERAVEEAERAVRLDPKLADAYLARAEVRSLILADWAGAQKDYQQALALAPGRANALAGYSRLLGALGRTTDAIQNAQLAADLDPLSAQSQYTLGSYYVWSGQYAAAQRTLEKAVALAPDHLGANFLGANELLNGSPGKALALFQSAPQVWARLWGTALAEHSLGHDDASRQALDQLIVASSKTAPYQIAEVYAWRGEHDKAFEWLGRAVKSQDSGLAALKADPMMRSLRADPRYVALLSMLRLPLD